MREFEIIVWSCINQKEDIVEIIQTGKSDPKQNMRNVINRLLMTGFFIKQNISDKDTASMIEAFFRQNFP